MLSQKNMKKTKLENMRLQERINYGYRKVILMMLISGLLSIVVIGVLFANMLHYINNVTVADQSEKYAGLMLIQRQGYQGNGIK